MENCLVYLQLCGSRIYHHKCSNMTRLNSSFRFVFLVFLTTMFYCNIEQKWSMQWNGRLVSVEASSCQKSEKKKTRKAGHFLATQGQGPSMAQLDLLRALRQEGTPLVPRGQTTPCCCPTGHIDSGKGSAQMEDCVFQSVHRCYIWIYQVAHISIRERTLDLFPVDTYTPGYSMDRLSTKRHIQLNY